jgi:hypothetical protein
MTHNRSQDSSTRTRFSKSSNINNTTFNLSPKMLETKIPKNNNKNISKENRNPEEIINNSNEVPMTNMLKRKSKSPGLFNETIKIKKTKDKEKDDKGNYTSSYFLFILINDNEFNILSTFKTKQKQPQIYLLNSTL